MKCPTCGMRTIVMQVRTGTNCKLRRRKCAVGHLSYTEEGFVAAPARKAPPICYVNSAMEISEDAPDWAKKIFAKL